MDGKKLAVRSISGLVYVGLIVGTLLWGSVPFGILTVVFAFLASLEFAKLTEQDHSISAMDTLSVAASMALASIPIWDVMIIVWIGILMLRFVAEVFSHSSSPIGNMGRFLLCQVWIAVPLLLMSEMAWEWGCSFVLGIFIMIWLNDTGAFLVGCTCGRHKLFERLSPKKTWEGFMGGLIFVVVFAVMVGAWAPRVFAFGDINQAALLAVTVVIAATLGDLFESKIKRSLNVKDSGNIMPGHGGILDRIDSLLFVMPSALLVDYLYRLLF